MEAKSNKLLSPRLMLWSALKMKRKKLIKAPRIWTHFEGLISLEGDCCGGGIYCDVTSFGFSFQSLLSSKLFWIFFPICSFVQTCHNFTSCLLSLTNVGGSWSGEWSRPVSFFDQILHWASSIFHLKWHWLLINCQKIKI